MHLPASAGPPEQKIPEESYKGCLEAGKCFKCGLKGHCAKGHCADKCKNGYRDAEGDISARRGQGTEGNLVGL